VRAGEPAAQKAPLRKLGMPIADEITEPGCLEGGDVVWLDERTIAVGRGYRTNDEGILQLRAILADSIDELIVVPLPHWRGPGDRVTEYVGNEISVKGAGGPTCLTRPLVRAPVRLD